MQILQIAIMYMVNMQIFSIVKGVISVKPAGVRILNLD